MSATPPSTLEGTETPNPFEVLWERYRSLILVIVTALVLALIGNYAWKYFEQRGIDEKWSSFAVNIGAAATYGDGDKVGSTLAEILKDEEMATLDKGLAAASDVQKPYFHLAIARKAMMDSDWARAESALSALETGYPKHTLLTESKLPPQVRDPKKVDDPEDRPETPEWEPATEGSVVGLMRKQIVAAKSFTRPAAFEMSPVPDDAPKVKFTVGEEGSFTIALMPNAKDHTAKFLELAGLEGGGFWKDIAVDEIQRSTTTRPTQPYAMHFGFASTKDEDRTKWSTTEPSEHEIDFEETKLSHFPGAVSARPGTDGKSAVDRLWISVDDDSNNDGSRVVFGYVVEGMDVLRSICEAGMSAQEQDQGRGRPSENYRITAVEVL